MTVQRPETIVPGTDEAGRYCHLAEEERPDVAVCGSTVRNHAGATGAIPSAGDETTCPVCGRPVCPACRSIFDVLNRTGAWEGP